MATPRNLVLVDPESGAVTTAAIIGDIAPVLGGRVVLVRDTGGGWSEGAAESSDPADALVKARYSLLTISSSGASEVRFIGELSQRWEDMANACSGGARFAVRTSFDPGAALQVFESTVVPTGPRTRVTLPVWTASFSPDGAWALGWTRNHLNESQQPNVLRLMRGDRVTVPKLVSSTSGSYVVRWAPDSAHVAVAVGGPFYGDDGPVAIYAAGATKPLARISDAWTPIGGRTLTTSWCSQDATTAPQLQGSPVETWGCGASSEELPRGQPRFRFPTAACSRSPWIRPAAAERSRSTGQGRCGC